MDVNFNCGFGDVICSVQEGIDKTLANWISSSIDFVFNNTGINTDTNLWSVAVNETSWWWGISILGVFVAALLGIGQVLIKRDKETLIRTIVGLIVVFPALTIAIWLTGRLLDFTAQLSPVILGRLTDGSLAEFISNMVLGSKDPAAAVINVAAGGIGNVTFILLGFAAGLFIIMLISAFRSFGLMVLIAFAPIVFMLIPLRIGEVWVKRWATAIVALIITQPLMEGMLVLVIKAGAATDTPWSMQMLPTLIGMGMMIFTPFAAFSMVKFLGAEMTPALQTGLGSKMQSGMMTLNQSRGLLGSLKGVGSKSGGAAAGAAAGGLGVAASAAQKTISAASNGTKAGIDATMNAGASDSGGGAAGGAVPGAGGKPSGSSKPPSGGSVPGAGDSA